MLKINLRPSFIHKATANPAVADRNNRVAESQIKRPEAGFTERDGIITGGMQIQGINEPGFTERNSIITVSENQLTRSEIKPDSKPEVKSEPIAVETKPIHTKKAKHSKPKLIPGTPEYSADYHKNDWFHFSALYTFIGIVCKANPLASIVVGMWLGALATATQDK